MTRLKDIITNPLLAVLWVLLLLQVPSQALADHLIPYPGGKTYLVRVSLADKNFSPYSLDKPHDFLSYRAIKRRERQHLAVDSTDLPVSPQYVRAVAASGFEVVGRSKWNNTLLVKCPSLDRLEVLKSLTFVKDVRVVFSSPDSTAAAHRTIYTEHLNRLTPDSSDLYGASGPQIRAMDGVRLHQAGFRGRGMLIAVVDAGFMNVDHIPAMREVSIIGIHNVVNSPVGDIFDAHDHGTKTLSAMALDVPHVYVGTAPEAGYVLIRSEVSQTESPSEEDYWAEAVELADSCGVDVINSSLGYHGFDNPDDNYHYWQQDGLTAYISRTASMLAQKGIVLVNSAGNDGMNSWKKINCPADARDILTVGAVTPQGVNAAFSSVGPTADGRVKPDVMAFGSPAAVMDGSGEIVEDMGTSFSSPIVCGMVACLWQALPDLTAKDIIDLVRKTASQADRPDNIYGYGQPDFWKAYQTGKEKQ